LTELVRSRASIETARSFRPHPRKLARAVPVTSCRGSPARLGPHRTDAVSASLHRIRLCATQPMPVSKQGRGQPRARRALFFHRQENSSPHLRDPELSRTSGLSAHHRRPSFLEHGLSRPRRPAVAARERRFPTTCWLSRPRCWTSHRPDRDIRSCPIPSWPRSSAPADFGLTFPALFD